MNSRHYVIDNYRFRSAIWVEKNW